MSPRRAAANTPPTRNVAQAISYASRRKIPYVFILGQRERSTNSVTIRDIRTEVQSTIPLSELPRLLSGVTL